MIKRERYIATHLDTDSAPDKRDTTSYYAAYNLEVVNNGRVLSINPTKTKKEYSSFSFGTLVGDVVIEELLYLFEYKEGEPYPDSIYSVSKIIAPATIPTITKIVSSNYGWDENTQLDIVGNRENENIIKVYWADNVNQLRALNVVDAPFPDGTVADIVLPVSLSKPTASIIQGGNLIAGKVQYAYTLFNLHGVETVISNLSAPLSISYDMEGGESGEVMPLSAEIIVSPIDTTFEYIRIYSVHYQEENQVPKITLIYETKVSGSTLTITDDGNLFISELSYEQFVFLGGVLVIPKTIVSKDNRLFAANYKTTNFDIDDTVALNSRVFGFGSIVVEHDQEFWTNEITQPLLPVDVINTPIINSPEDYAFDQDVHSSPNAYTGESYNTIDSGTKDEDTWSLVSLQLEGVGDTEYTEAVTESGGAGWYNLDTEIVITLTGTPGNTDVTWEVSVGSSASGPWELASSGSVLSNPGGYDEWTAESYETTLNVSHVKVHLTNSSSQHRAVMNSFGDKQIVWEALQDILITDPGDDATWVDYDISNVEYGGTDTLDIGGNYYTPDTVQFDSGTKLATFIFYTNPGVLIPGNTYNGEVEVNTRGLSSEGGSRTHVNDSTDVRANIDLTSSQVGYEEYTVLMAAASGTANFVSPSYSHPISTSSFAVGTEVLSIFCNDIPLAGSIPTNTYPNGVNVTTLTSNGTKTPEDSAGSELRVKTIADVETVYATPSDVPLTHDAINPDYDVYNLQGDIATIGYEGTNFALSFSTTTTVNKDTRSLKQGEVYRIGIVYYNEYMQRTPAKWMCDIKIPYFTPSTAVFLDCEFIGNSAVFQAEGVTSFQLVIVKREPKDRSVSSPGFIVPSVEYIWQIAGTSATGYKHPYYTLKRIFYDHGSDFGGDITEDYKDGIDFGPIDAYPSVEAAIPSKDDTIMFFYSSDTAFLVDSMYPPESIKIIGSASVASNAIPTQHGDTKITLKLDGGIHGTSVIDNTLYYDLSVYTTDMPESLLRILHVDSPVGVIQPEYVLQHTYLDITPPSDTYADITLVDSVVLKANTSGKVSSTKVANNINIKDIWQYTGGDDRTVSYAANFANSVVLEFSSGSWHVDGDLITDWSKFAYPTSGDYKLYLPLVELLRDVPNQYGGGTYEDKQRNNYMLNGEATSITSSSNITQYSLGDIYIGPLLINRSDGLNTLLHGYWNIYENISIPKLEHNIDIYSRNDEMYEWSSGLSTSTMYELFRLEDNHELLGAYNQQNELILGIAKPTTFTDVETFNASIIASKQKFPNEVIDSWTDFLVNDTMDLDGIYGDITKLYNFTNEVFSFQLRAVSAITINPRVQLQADDGIGVELGTGTVLYRYKYLTTKSGTNQIWSVTDDNAAMYYYDDVSQSINVHTGEELSTVKKIRNLMQGLVMPVPLEDLVVRSMYDIGKQDVIFVFDDISLVYNKYIGEFTRTEDIHNYIHTFNNKVFSLVNSNLNEHYAGTNYNAMHITYMFAPMPTYDKVFHNIEYRKVGDNNFNYIEVEDTINRTGIINDPTINNKFNINRIHIPRVDNTLERFRDVNILLTLQCPESVDLMSIDDMVLMYNIKG